LTRTAVVLGYVYESVSGQNRRDLEFRTGALIAGRRHQTYRAMRNRKWSFGDLGSYQNHGNIPSGQSNAVDSVDRRQRPPIFLEQRDHSQWRGGQ
jgi:hypothetical protein